MRTMAKDPVILGSGKRVEKQDEIIKGAEKLVDLLFFGGGNIDDQVDAGSQRAELSSRNIPSSRRLHCSGVQSRRGENYAARFQQKCGKTDGRVGGARAPLAEPESSRVTPPGSPSTEEPDRLLPSPELDDCDRVPDEVDGIQSDLAFTDKPEEEKDELLTEIAEKLKTIGDSYEKKGSATASASTLLSVSLATDVVETLASNLTYENFEEAVSQAIGNEPGLQQLVFAYRLASAVGRKVGSAGSRGAAGCYLSYLKSNLTGWVAENGGWRGVLAML